MAPQTPTPAVISPLVEALSAARNMDGGWGYYSSKSSRLEPCAWIALGPSDLAPGALAWLQHRESAGGWCTDDPQAPVNYAFNGLALLALLTADNLPPQAERLCQALIGVKGLAAGPSSEIRQNNSLQAWSWIDGTFSWVEPTACCLLAVKRARDAGVIAGSAMAARITVAEQMLADRACDGGGWNYGNARVFDKNLAPHGPTTALALLALQDRRDLPAVEAGLAFLSTHAESERSGMALALTSICLRVFDCPSASLASATARQALASLVTGNTVTLAALLVALSDEPEAIAPFRLRVR